MKNKRTYQAEAECINSIIKERGWENIYVRATTWGGSKILDISYREGDEIMLSKVLSLISKDGNYAVSHCPFDNRYC